MVSDTPAYRVQQALDHLEQGKIIILVDDIKEKEADLMIAAKHATPENIAHFLDIAGAGGLFCIPLASEAIDYLALKPMTDNFNYTDSCNLMEGVDSKKGGTGISADDRALVIDHLITGQPGLLAKPGHTFPLRERIGGFGVRQGHTESSLKLISLAEIMPYGAAIQEIMRRGNPIKGGDIERFAHRYDKPIVSISDMKDYIQAGCPSPGQQSFF